MTSLTQISEICTPAGPLPDAPTLPDQYDVRGCLGEGGFGRVYEAWDSKLCRPVAIKCIKHADAARAGADLMREARLGASLRHAAFVKVHAIEDDGCTQSIVMELVPGQTLKQVLAAGPVARADALEWTRQVAEAMRDAHASGLVHGDLKPSNLMLEPGGAIRILDFGLAHQLDVLATAAIAPEVLQGTIAYMAPERMLGAPLSPQVDVYALGLILYEMVCGARPFAALDGLALAAAQVQTTSDGWSYPLDTSPQLIALIRAMTARQAPQRLAGMAEVLARLAQLEAPLVSPAPPARKPMPARTRRVLAGVLSVALLGAAGWAAAPYLATLGPSLAPFSESVEMEQGLAALKLFDRPGSLDSAEQHFRRILERRPDSAAAAAGMSLMYIQRYQTDKRDETWLQRANASAQRAAQLNDQLALSHIARGWVLDNQGKRDDALLAHAEGLRLDPTNFFALYGQGVTLRRMHRYDEARARLEDAIARFPQERVFTDELGSVYYEQADYPAAERLFRRSIALQPDAVIAYANLNAALLRQNRDDEALQVLQQGLQIRPSAKLYTNLGNALFLRQDYVGAAAAFENAVSPTRGAPGEYQLWANLADTLNWIPGREKQARAAYDKARELLAPRLARAPDDVLLVSRMGLYAARTGAQAEAATLLPRAIALAPTSADVQFRAGLAYELLGQRDAALVAINSARRLGYPVKFIDAEPDLVALRRDARYRPD
ncbi:serine/threonine-protein kinase [Massilia yuzhufengensis]|uniref:non-specific serine/threonine protein kinase n=1 Tax=Massilia yuzhufengensis TaxID=1164594 RepID=A0A1I1JWF2_9BURK|nr:serine/threonine-protein kinase [Massilia yuzhufengensis]SFC53009.1 serine/threonine protein kinase [Massilia yuzhufengensis]